MVERAGRGSKLRKAINVASRLLVVTGLLLIGVYALARVHTLVMSRMALRQFDRAEQAEPASANASGAPQVAKHDVDFSLWSMKRINAYEDSLSKQFAPPLAVLSIPKIRLEVPVLDGTDDLTLNRGVGRIIGTARPGQGGNLGIAGHRDGFFRGLKDVAVGDVLELEMVKERKTYKVDQIRIVQPTDTEVLQDRGVPSVTLVTCYPFYFIGNAPQRYIVQASLVDDKLGEKPRH